MKKLPRFYRRGCGVFDRRRPGWVCPFCLVGSAMRTVAMFNKGEWNWRIYSWCQTRKGAR